MDTYRAFLAILISFVILLGYQYFFVGFPQEDTAVEGEVTEQTTAVVPQNQQIQTQQQVISQPPVAKPVLPAREVEKIEVETDLFNATISDNGGIIESFILKKHKETNEEDSPGKQLIATQPEMGYPLKFSWGGIVPAETQYELQNDQVVFRDGKGELRLSATTPSGLEVEKIFIFDKSSYLVDLVVNVKNPTDQTLQGNPQIFQVNVPFQQKTTINRFLFSGPSYFLNNELAEIKAKEFKEGPQSYQGIFDWIAYEGTYFMCGIVPEDKKQSTYTVQGSEELVYSSLAGPLDTLAPDQQASYKYKLYYGPKKLSLLQETGYNLDKSVDFGWFDIIARPTLSLLNFFYDYIGNYGVAIILVTIIFKAIFWPITQKGLKSMKNMQKLQPKMMKLKEKYKDDPQTMNREVMNLYKTYKVNPLGGCLPMVLQIPVFFALYKVLLLCIELRHAPFMLWISDLSAPDRLWIGFEIPWLGGLPILTLLMGASMFIQQKLTPTTADPTQARIMMMLPVVFTFMFLNFASGLVLYWFVNNLLSILQQQLINRGVAK